MQRFSMIDYPGKACAIIFTQGCGFRCSYCHNPELVQPEQFGPTIDQEEVLAFLRDRVGKLDAITITGGEPTLQPDLMDFMRQVKAMGYLIKLDSNGTNPVMLKKILDEKLADYVAMDIKAPLEKYPEITCVPVNRENIQASVEMIMNSGLPYEFRTTIVRSMLSTDDLLAIGDWIKGAELYAMQKFVPTKANDPEILSEETYTDQEFETLRGWLESKVKKCIVR